MGVLAVLLVGHVRAGEGNADGSVAQPIGIWRTDVNDGVMHAGAAGRLNFGHLDPFVLREVGGDDFVGVVNIAVSGEGDGFGHAHDCVGLRNHPTFRPLARRWRGVRIAGGGLRIGPGNEGGNFLWRERGIVREMADGGIGKPRRHFAFGGGIGDGAGERAGLGVGHQLHRADFAGAVAALAMLLEDGQDVAIERGRSNQGLRWLGRRLRRGLIFLLLRGAGGREQQEQDRWQRDSQEIMDAGWAVGVFVLEIHNAGIVHRARRWVR